MYIRPSLLALMLGSAASLMLTDLAAALEVSRAETGKKTTVESITPGKETKVAKTAIIYETSAEQSDLAFTESAHRGAELARKNLGVDYQEFRVSEDERQPRLKAIAESGASSIVAVGFQFAVPVMMLAEEFPKVQFTVIDGFVPPIYPNVLSITFNDNEGAFLVGMIAASTSKSGIIGFVGGMDVPIIRNFYYGYRHGANYVNPNIVVLNQMIGSTASAWNDPSKAASLAKKQYDEGADIVFAAAGGSSIGVLQAAEQSDKLAIGVDINQNPISAGHVLTSMVKRVDKAVYDVLENSKNQNWQPGNKYLGLRDGALDYAVDTNNSQLITKELIDKVEDTKDLINRGTLKVDMYTPN